MSDNVIDFNTAYENAKECEHEHTCGHCEFIENTVENFLDRIDGLDTYGEEFEEELKILIEFVEFKTKQEVLADLGHNLLQMSGVLDEEE